MEIPISLFIIIGPVLITGQSWGFAPPPVRPMNNIECL